MKTLKAILPLFLLFFFAICMADYRPANKKKYSLIDENDKIYRQFEDYGKKYSNIQSIESSVTVISALLSDFERQMLPETTQEIAGREVLEYLNESVFSNLGYSSQKWKKKDTLPADYKTESSSQTTKPQQEMLPPGIIASLPFEAQLSLSGRKLIGMEYTARQYDKEEDGKRKNTSSLNMEQELQMRILGRVGNRLDINVDYDDTADKKDISLVYKGAPDEFIEEAAFGDISVALPTTEFMNYSKELFGLKVDTRYKTYSLDAFFSKTKGASEIKRFEGNTQLERKTIADTSYIRLKYFSINDPNISIRPIKAGSARIFMDYQRIDPNLNVSITTSTPLNFLKNRTISPTDQYRGNFVLLVAGQDYTIDYNTGIITFRNQLASNYVAAVDYQYIDDTWLSSGGSAPGVPLIIKDVNNTTQRSMELKTYYNLGNLKIIRDNGRGNFTLELKDLNGDVPTVINPGNKTMIPSYPSNITVDFENGIFHLNPVDGEPLADDLYTLNNHRYDFITEYQYVVKILTLRPGIVPQSEKVIISGRELKANTDYIIDYDLGILTIINETLITATSVIDVSYDYSMFGSAAESTLVGMRTNLNLTNNISIGGSLLYDFTAKGAVLPDIRSTPRSLLVGEGDIKITDLKINSLNITINAAAEYAVSSQDDNTSSKALIDSFDSAVYEDNAAMVDESWLHSADKSPATKRNLNELSWRSYDIALREISPQLEIVDGQKQLVLEIDYDVTTRSQIAMAQKLSLSGYDFSKKLYAEVWIKGDGKGAKFAVDYTTSINEDTDGNGLLDTEDTDGNGIISPWEDTGQTFHDVSGGQPSLIGAHNGKLDTEDLNGNGILDTFENVAGGIDLSVASAVITDENGITHNSIDWTGWKRFKIPLDMSSPENWKNIRILRLRIIRNSGGQAGKIIIGKISIVGNKWEKSDSNPLNVTSSIGISDPDYVSLLSNSYYQELYDTDNSIKKDEQSLRLQYVSTITARSVYIGEALDISKYDSIRFFVFPKNAQPGDQIIFRAGSNDDNYFEYKLHIDAADIGRWKLIKIDQEGSGRAVRWSSSEPAAVITSSGTPSLEKISQITVGVIPSVPLMNGDVWFNEIHVMGSKKINGTAWHAGGNIRWNGSKRIGAITLGANRKAIERDFQTVTAGVYNRDYLEDKAYVSFDGFRTETLMLLPIKAQLSKTRTVTPNIINNNSNLISIKEEGTVVTYSGFGETSLDLGVDFPKLAAQYSRAVIDSSEIEQLEDRETISGSLVYNNPVVFPLLPTNVMANAQIINSYYKVYPSTPMADSDSFLGLDAFKSYLDINEYHTLEQTEMFAVKLPFKFSKGILFSPSYLMDRIREKNRDFAQEISYDKTLNQTVGASLVLGIINWFSPTFTYSINTKENYNVISSTNPVNLIIPGEKKYIERSGIGEISWNLNAYDIASNVYLKSLVFSAYYRLQDSDSYENVYKEFNSTGFSADKLWIRNNNLMEILPSYSSNSYTVKSILNRDDIRVNGRYAPFEAFKLKGHLSPLNTLIANFTYTEGSESSYITGTIKDVYTQIWPELLVGMSGIERFFGSVSWMSDTQFNFKFHNKHIITYGVSNAEDIMYGFDYRCKLFKKFDLYFSIENTGTDEDDFETSKSLSNGLAKKIVGQGAFDWGKWRFSLRYENEDQWRTNAEGKYATQVLRNSYLGQINSDLTLPAGIKIPFINKIIPLTNRIIFLSNLKYITQDSETNIETDNNTNYGANLSADYEISKYFRITLGASYDRFEYTYNPNLNYTNLSFVSKLTIQF
ncbi:MAG: hypothetical protein LBD46_07870 [Endomicrobium sp.]|jgi:hypothetical protein|nr:hypothetical protein [Endomicrobium sp.]